MRRGWAPITWTWAAPSTTSPPPWAAWGEQARLGADHPDAASTLANLATVLRDLGDLPAARAALTRALSVLQARFGPDHPDVAQTRTSLQIVASQLSEVPGRHTPTPGALPLFEARVGAGNPLPTLIPRRSGSGAA